MKNATLDHKCPNCDAILKFQPHGQNWQCEYCRSVFTREEIEAVEAKKGHTINEETKPVEVEKNEEGIDIYTCPNCGAEIVADEETSATFCVYCGSTAILKNRLVGEFNPSKVIPFHKTKEDAQEAFIKVGKGKPFLPKSFTAKENIAKMKGVYDIEVSSSITAEGKKIRTWRSGDYQYTKTDTYDIYRDGNMQFEKIPVDGSTRFYDELMNSIEPFDYQELQTFSPSYLSGFYAEKYDVESSVAEKDARERAENSTVDTLRESIHGFQSVDIEKKENQVSVTKQEYVLLPVWMLNIEYHGKRYMFAMNGQTGEMIGDLPIDKKKAALTAILLFVGIFLGLCLLWFFMGGGGR